MAAIKPDYDDSVVSTNIEFERLCGKPEFHQLLIEGLNDIKKNAGRPAKDVFTDIEIKFGFGGI